MNETVERVQRTVQQTTAAGSARIRQTMTSSAQPAVVATGCVDFRRRRAYAVMAFPGDPDLPGAHEATEVAMVVDGADLYVEVLDRPGRWIIDRRTDDGPAQYPGDPGLLLDWLRGTTHANAAGKAAVKGIETTMIDVTVDLDRAIERAPDELRRTLRALLDGVVPHQAQARVWLDEQDRLRKIVVALTPTPAQPLEQLDVELFDFSDDVSIELPPSSAILTDDEMAELGAELAERFDGEPVPPPSDWDNDGATVRNGAKP